MTQPAKRPAYEPAGRLMQPVRFDPGMQRPVTVVAGAVLVLLRVLAGIFVLLDIALNWHGLVGQAGVELLGDSLTPDIEAVGLVVVVTVGAATLVADLLLAFFILRGSNTARVIVMLLSVISISTAFVGWWAQGQEVTLKTSLASLALDILVLLALSSRSAAAYARRNERR